MIRGELTSCDLTIAGKPEPQPRPLPVRRGKRIAMISTKSGPADDYKKAISQAAKELMSRERVNPVRCAIAVELTLVFDRVGRLDKFDPQTRVWHDVGPDADNVAKAVLDACNRILFEDDRQICALTVKKFYGRVGESASTRIVIRSFQES